MRGLLLCSPRAELHGSDAEWSPGQPMLSPVHGHMDSQIVQAFRRGSFADVPCDCTVLRNLRPMPLVRGALEVKSQARKLKRCEPSSPCYFATHPAEVIGHPCLVSSVSILTHAWSGSRILETLCPLRQLPRILQGGREGNNSTRRIHLLATRYPPNDLAFNSARECLAQSVILLRARPESRREL